MVTRLRRGCGCAAGRGRRRRVRRGPPGAAARRRLLGHRRVTRRSGRSWARPTRPASRPTSSSAGSASVVLQPFGEPAFRMNLLSALCLAAAAGAHRRPRPGPDPLDGARRRGRARAGPHADRLGDRDPCRGARPPPRARRDPAAAAPRRLGGPGPGRRRRRTATATGDRRSLARRGGRRVRARGRQPLADPARWRPPVGLFVLAVEPAIWRRGRLVVGCVAGARRHRRRSSTSSCRCGPGRSGRPLVYGRPETWDGFWYVVLGRAVPGQPGGSVRRPAAASSATLVDRTAGEFGPLAPLIPLGFLATVVRRPRYALLTGAALAHHLLLRGVLRERRHRPLLPRCRRSSPGPGWRSWPAPSVDRAGATCVSGRRRLAATATSARRVPAAGAGRRGRRRRRPAGPDRCSPSRPATGAVDESGDRAAAALDRTTR